MNPWICLVHIGKTSNSSEITFFFQKKSVKLKGDFFSRKAWQMYAESIQDSSPRKFFAIQCANAEAFLSGHCCHSQALLRLAIMGEFIHNGTLGTFHLLTNRESPLAMTKEDSINCHL